MVIEYRIVYPTADSYKHIETDGLSDEKLGRWLVSVFYILELGN